MHGPACSSDDESDGPIADASFDATFKYYAKHCLSEGKNPVDWVQFRKRQASTNGLHAAELCDRCGMHGDGDVMPCCECCSENGKEVVTHYSCIDKAELIWLLQDGDNHHWRCSQCR